MGIGEKLNDLMNEKNRNVNDISVKTGIPPSTIYSIIKRNNTKMDLDVLQTIADELGVTLDYFLSKPRSTANRYFVQEDTAEYLEGLHKRPELKALFSATKNATKEDIEKAMKVIEVLKEQSK